MLYSTKSKARLDLHNPKYICTNYLVYMLKHTNIYHKYFIEVKNGLLPLTDNGWGVLVFYVYYILVGPPRDVARRNKTALGPLGQNALDFSQN